MYNEVGDRKEKRKYDESYCNKRGKQKMTKEDGGDERKRDEDGGDGNV